MHGRLKVKTTAEQEIEKQKERNIKLEKYLKGTNLLFFKKEKLEHDTEALIVSSKLLFSNPDALTFWNFRRNVLLTLERIGDEDSWQRLLEGEMNVTETCLLKNPKSYGAWHHRDWLFNNFPMPPYEKELQLCDQFIQKDERNFHCWDHRRLIVNKSNHCLTKELAYTQELIEKNFSNFSAWHYRSKLLPVLHPPTKDSSHPIKEEIFIKELEKVFAAVFTDPSDQSPWFFLRWLISKREENPRLIQIGILPSTSSTKSIVLVFSKLVTSIEHLCICVDDIKLNLDSIKPNENACIWILPFTSSVESFCIKVSHKEWFTEQEFIYNSSSFPIFQWISKELNCQRVFSKESEKILLKIMNDCIQLDKLDPGNKWVLLTLVDIMSALSIRDYQKDILFYLNQLETIDFLRVNYYRDVRSMVLSEVALITFIEDGLPAFALTSQNLTTLTSSQFLCSAETIDLSFNSFNSLTFIASFLNCREVYLDGNTVRDLMPVSKLKYLRKLSMNNCNIDSVELFLPLFSCNYLLELLIEDNPISKIDDAANIITKLIPNVKNIKL